MIIQEKDNLLMAWSEKEIDGDIKITAHRISSVDGELFTILGDLKGSAFPCKGLDLYVALIPT